MDVPREDGDSVRVWVRATDVTTLCCVSERERERQRLWTSPREDGDSVRVRVWVRATDVTTLCCVSETDSDCGRPERGR